MSQKSVNFHIKSDDYFGTLATIISLFEENTGKIKNHSKSLKNIVNDLIYLQKNYKIIKKD
jgi:hypothetical protein